MGIPVVNFFSRKYDTGRKHVNNTYRVRKCKNILRIVHFEKHVDRDDDDSDSSPKGHHPVHYGDYLKFDQFHDAEDFFAAYLSQHSSDIEHPEPDEQSSSESEFEIDFGFED